MHCDEHVFCGTEHRTPTTQDDSFIVAISRRVYNTIPLYLPLYIDIWSISNLSSVVKEEIRIVRRVLTAPWEPELQDGVLSTDDMLRDVILAHDVQSWGYLEKKDYIARK